MMNISRINNCWLITVGTHTRAESQSSVPVYLQNEKCTRKIVKSNLDECYILFSRKFLSFNFPQTNSELRMSSTGALILFCTEGKRYKGTDLMELYKKLWVPATLWSRLGTTASKCLPNVRAPCTKATCLRDKVKGHCWFCNWINKGHGCLIESLLIAQHSGGRTNHVTGCGLTVSSGCSRERRRAGDGSIQSQDVDDSCLQLGQDQHQLQTHKDTPLTWRTECVCFPFDPAWAVWSSSCVLPDTWRTWGWSLACARSSSGAWTWSPRATGLWLSRCPQTGWSICWVRWCWSETSSHEGESVKGEKLHRSTRTQETPPCHVCNNYCVTAEFF